jgi:uncharacterized protein YcnI
MKKIIVTFAALVVCGFTFNIATAHVVVLPKEAPAESYQTFTVGVPVERDVATVGLRLVVPEGVVSVRPNIKPGWTITMKRLVKGEKEEVTEIMWTGGSIPTGLRDEFVFSAKTPKDGKVPWKAYQTYADGKVVAWENDPEDEHGHTSHENVEGPYSITQIVAHDEHGEGHGESGHGIGHDMLLPLLGIGIGLACVIEIGRMRKGK